VSRAVALVGVAKGSRRPNRSRFPHQLRQRQRAASSDAGVRSMACFVECKSPYDAARTSDRALQILLSVTQSRSNELSISEEQALALP